MDKLIDDIYRILVINKESLCDTNILFHDCDNCEEIIQEFYSKYGLKIYLRGSWRYNNEEIEGEGYYVYASLEDWNTFMPYTSFQTDIELLQSKNYNPIAVCQLFFEDTFVFTTPEEAHTAFEEFERNATRENRIVGWWYGLEDFKKTVRTYELEGNRVLIHWIKPTELIKVNDILVDEYGAKAIVLDTLSVTLNNIKEAKAFWNKFESIGFYHVRELLTEKATIQLLMVDINGVNTNIIYNSEKLKKHESNK